MWSHLDLTWIWWLWFPYGALLDLGPVVSIWLCWKMTVIHIWAAPEPLDSGPYLGIIGTWILSYISGPHLDMVTVVPPGPHLHELTGSHRDLTWTG